MKIGCITIRWGERWRKLIIIVEERKEENMLGKENIKNRNRCQE